MSADFQRAILDLATEDWYGLWEMYFDVSRALHREPDEKFRDDLRRQLADMMAQGLLKAAIWSEGPPRPVSPDEVRFLQIDSELWGSPMHSDSLEQLRITATEAGDRKYFGPKKSTS